jgi:hypothetical protein
MWTPTTRAQHSRAGLRYGSDLTDAVIDSQSVKRTESGGIRGYDAGKKIRGRKRHAMVDTNGRALKLQAHAADIQDCDEAGPLLRASLRVGPSWHCAMPMAATLVPLWPKPARSVSRWCARPTTRSASPSLPGDGLSSGSSPGSTETGALQRTSRPRSRASKPSSTPLPASSCYEGWPVDQSIRNGL